MSFEYDYLDSIDRAREFVRAARVCLDSGYANAAASRAYYGALHAGVAALDRLAKDQSARSLLSGRTHERVARLYDESFVNRRKVFPEHKGWIHELRERRHDADYRSGVTEREARGCVKKAETLLGDIERRLVDEGHYCTSD